MGMVYTVCVCIQCTPPLVCSVPAWPAALSLGGGGGRGAFGFSPSSVTGSGLVLGEGRGEGERRSGEFASPPSHAVIATVSGWKAEAIDTRAARHRDCCGRAGSGYDRRDVRTHLCFEFWR